jgi:tetratricopeptide (TPR) repeat protein
VDVILCEATIIGSADERAGDFGFVVPASAGSVGSQPLRSHERGLPRTLPAEAGTTNPNAWKRWNDYGIGLLEQSQYGLASTAFRRASELSPADPDLLVNATLAEMHTERFGPEREQWRKAAALFDRALALKPEHPRAFTRPWSGAPTASRAKQGSNWRRSPPVFRATANSCVNGGRRSTRWAN